MYRRRSTPCFKVQHNLRHIVYWRPLNDVLINGVDNTHHLLEYDAYSRSAKFSVQVNKFSPYTSLYKYVQI
jgi:hypothetical protein